MFRPSRIIHFITTINRGGAENHLYQLASMQNREGCQLLIIYLKGDGYWKTKLETQGIQVVNLQMKFYGDLLPAVKLRKTINEFKPDLIHIHTPPAEVYVRLIYDFIVTKCLVTTKHSDGPFIDSLGINFLGRWAAEKTTRFIAISQAVKKSAIAAGLNPERFDLIPHGIEVSSYLKVDGLAREKIRQELGIKDCLVFTVVARLAHQKRIDLILESFDYYLTVSQTKAHLLIVGSGYLEKELKAKAEELPSRSCITFLGFSDKIPELLSASDVFVFASEYEGFGLVLLEAMVSGLPIIATSTGAIPEIIQHGVNGFLVPFFEKAKFVGFMQQLEDKSLRHRLGSIGRNLAMSEFTLEKMTEKTWETYQKALSTVV